VRIYGIRHWIEQDYKQVKGELGWADFQVRSDVAIRRQQVLVNCAFCFCWTAWFVDRVEHPVATYEAGGPLTHAIRDPPVALVVQVASRLDRLCRDITCQDNVGDLALRVP